MKILVVGEYCIDRYIYGRCTRLSPEGPVPVFIPSMKKQYNGMAGNTFANLQNIKEDSDELEIITNDHSDESEKCIKTRFIEEKSNQILLRMDKNDSCQRISQPYLEKVKNYLSNKDFDLLIVSDYNKGFLTDEDLIHIAKLANFAIIDSKRKLSASIIEAFDFIKLNQQEYENNIEQFQSLSNKAKLIVTMGAEGVQFMDHIYEAPEKIQTFDVSGAGDVISAALSYSLCKSHAIIDSIRYAQMCCSKVIKRRGTCVYEKNMD